MKNYTSMYQKQISNPYTLKYIEIWTMLVEGKIWYHKDPKLIYIILLLQ